MQWAHCDAATSGSNLRLVRGIGPDAAVTDHCQSRRHPQQRSMRGPRYTVAVGAERDREHTRVLPTADQDTVARG